MPEEFHLGTTSVGKYLVEPGDGVAPENKLRLFFGRWLEIGFVQQRLVVEQPGHGNDKVPEPGAGFHAGRQARPGACREKAITVKGQHPLGQAAPFGESGVASAVVVHHVVVFVAIHRHEQAPLVHGRITGKFAAAEKIGPREDVDVVSNARILTRHEWEVEDGLPVLPKEGQNRRLCSWIKDTVDDPAFFASRQGGFVLEQEFQVVERLSGAMARRQVVADDAIQDKCVRFVMQGRCVITAAKRVVRDAASSDGHSEVRIEDTTTQEFPNVSELQCESGGKGMRLGHGWRGWRFASMSSGGGGGEGRE